MSLLISCEATTSKGQRCKHRPKYGQTLCTFHFNRLGRDGTPHQCTATTARGMRCKNAEQTHHSGLCWRHEQSSHANANMCRQNVSEGGVYHRCSNTVSGDSMYCHVHQQPSNELEEEHPQIVAMNEAPQQELWMPRVQDIVPLVRPSYQQCCAHDHGEGESLIRCILRPTPSSREGKYCSNHAYKYRLDRSDGTCSICMESIDETTEVPLSCGHWFHKACLRGCREAKCPLCRTSMTEQERVLYIQAELNYDIAHQLALSLHSLTNHLMQRLNREDSRTTLRVVNLLWNSPHLQRAVSILNDPLLNMLQMLAYNQAMSPQMSRLLEANPQIQAEPFEVV